MLSLGLERGALRWVLIALSVAASKEAFTLRPRARRGSRRTGPTSMCARSSCTTRNLAATRDPSNSWSTPTTSAFCVSGTWTAHWQGRLSRLIPVGQNQNHGKGLLRRAAGRNRKRRPGSGRGNAVERHRRSRGGQMRASSKWRIRPPRERRGPQVPTNASGSSGAFGGSSGSSAGSVRFRSATRSGAFGGSSGLGSAAGMQSRRGWAFPAQPAPSWALAAVHRQLHHHANEADHLPDLGFSL